MPSENSKLKMGSADRSYEFALEIIALLDRLPSDTVSRTIGSQLLRSATSIGANIVEAQASPSRRDFANFFNHSLKSANETKYWLRLLLDSKRANANAITPLLNEASELAKILASSVLTLRGKRQL